jgi:hypothetical protein
VEGRVAEGEDAAVGAEQVVAVAGRGGLDVDDRRVQPPSGHVAVVAGGAEGVHTTGGLHHPVAAGRGVGGHADGRAGRATHGRAVEPRVVGEHPAVARHEPVADPPRLRDLGSARHRAEEPVQVVGGGVHGDLGAVTGGRGAPGVGVVGEEGLEPEVGRAPDARRREAGHVGGATLGGGARARDGAVEALHVDGDAPAVVGEVDVELGAGVAVDVERPHDPGDALGPVERRERPRRPGGQVELDGRLVAQRHAGDVGAGVVEPLPLEVHHVAGPVGEGPRGGGLEAVIRGALGRVPLQRRAGGGQPLPARLLAGVVGAGGRRRRQGRHRGEHGDQAAGPHGSPRVGCCSGRGR